MTNYRVPYADSELTFNAPAGWLVDVAQTAIPDLPPIPLDVPPIDIGDHDHAIIIFTDATRHSPDQWFAQKILAALPLPAEKVTFLCALGMHRPSTHQEKIDKLGAEIVARYAVIDHNPAGVVTIGEIDGIPVEVNPLLVQAGAFVIMTGVVEPHQYAGYSGGAKTAVIGCGGARTIGMTHGPAMLDRAGVRLGEIAGNPFQDFVRRAGAMIGVDMIANAVMPAHDLVTHAAVGRVAIHDDLVAQARRLYETPVPNAPYDVVIAGVGAPKDANLYQASRAATYIGLSGTPVLRQGGVIILPALLPEGAGTGVGEQNFYAALQQYGASAALMAQLRARGCQPGEQRAYMIAQLLGQYHCIVVGASDPDVVTGVGLHHTETLAAALTMAARLCGVPTPKLLIVPEAVKTIPVVSGTAH